MYLSIFRSKNSNTTYVTSIQLTWDMLEMESEEAEVELGAFFWRSVLRLRRGPRVEGCSGVDDTDRGHRWDSDKGHGQPSTGRVEPGKEPEAGQWVKHKQEEHKGKRKKGWGWWEHKTVCYVLDLYWLMEEISPLIQEQANDWLGWARLAGDLWKAERWTLRETETLPTYTPTQTHTERERQRHQDKEKAGDRCTRIPTQSRGISSS